MRIRELYRSGKPEISFEIFPPKTPKGLAALLETCRELASLKPVFISGTYGAGGSTQGKTLEVLEGIRRRHSVGVTAHLTCIGSTHSKIKDWLSEASSMEIENIMALRGDLPKNAAEENIFEIGELHYASDLVSFIKEHFPHFGIGVAGYPETHREAADKHTDLKNLKRKVDAGADAVYTQLFFDNEDFFRFRDECDAVGVRVPIVPGILPILSLAQVEKITTLCGAKLPQTLRANLERHAHDTEAMIQIGIEHAALQTRSLIQSGTPGIHYYVLNRSDVIRKVLTDELAPSIPTRAENQNEAPYQQLF